MLFSGVVSVIASVDTLSLGRQLVDTWRCLIIYMPQPTMLSARLTCIVGMIPL